MWCVSLCVVLLGGLAGSIGAENYCSAILGHRPFLDERSDKESFPKLVRYIDVSYMRRTIGDVKGLPKNKIGGEQFSRYFKFLLFPPSLPRLLCSAPPSARMQSRPPSGVPPEHYNPQREVNCVRSPGGASLLTLTCIFFFK